VRYAIVSLAIAALVTGCHCRCHRGQVCCETVRVYPHQVVPRTVEKPVEMPVVPVSEPPPPLPSPPPPPQVEAPRDVIKPEYLPLVGNAADYRWVTGQLIYTHVDGGTWVVRYQPVEKEDRYGGSVVLANAVSMASFQEGDLVKVCGEILDEGRANIYLGGPLYRPTSVTLVKRIQP
jgi:hypothetical protein